MAGRKLGGGMWATQAGRNQEILESWCNLSSRGSRTQSGKNHYGREKVRPSATLPPPPTPDPHVKEVGEKRSSQSSV